MVSERIIVTNKTGIHARPASELSKVAIKCESNISTRYKEKEVNPKSIIMLSSAMINRGSEIEVVCEGKTEKEDLQTLIDTINSGLGE